ncbi:hypothetical protein ACFW2V_24765 [Streptomyces sp. NPDC058947]
MSTFVLHPPARLEIAAFFVTSRFSGLHTREAFLKKTVAQLAALCGQQSPLAATER